MYMPRATNTSTLMPPAHPDELNEDAPSEGSSVGTLVAIAVATIAGTTLLLVLGWYLRRRWSQRTRKPYARASVVDDDEDDRKPYIITPYTVPSSRPGSSAPHMRPHSPDSDLEVVVLSYDAPSPGHTPSNAPASDPGPGTWNAIDIKLEEHEHAAKPSAVGATFPASPTAPDTLTRITSPTLSIALEPTRLSGEYPRGCASPSSLVLATTGLASVANELKGKKKRKRKSKIQSVPRPKSFCIDKSRTGHSPIDDEDVPPPLPFPWDVSR